MMIQTKNLSRFYKNLKAVNSLSINVPRGKVYGFLGRNGAGKTTTIRLLLGLIQKNSGKIIIDGQDFDKNRTKSLKNIGSMVEIPGFYNNLTARENLGIYHRLIGVQDKNAIEKTLEMVSLHEAGHRPVKNFSLGMKQRLGLARAILHDPEILILDEPTNGLDPAGIRKIRELIISLSRDYGKTVFVSSHILSEVEQIADVIGIVQEGQLLKELSLEELHRINRRYIKAVAAPVEKAAFVLEKGLGIHDYQILPGNEIRIYEKIDASAKINESLIKNSISVSEIHLSKDNLEDYFLKLTGGVQC